MGCVHIDAIKDEMMKEATIAQINNFGQTPKCVFNRPHPKRNPTVMVPTVYSHCDALTGVLLKSTPLLHSSR